MLLCECKNKVGLNEWRVEKRKPYNTYPTHVVIEYNLSYDLDYNYTAISAPTYQQNQHKQRKKRLHHHHSSTSQAKYSHSFISILYFSATLFSLENKTRIKEPPFCCCGQTMKTNDPMNMIRERWKHALSANKPSHPIKILSLSPSILSFSSLTVPPPLTRIFIELRA